MPIKEIQIVETGWYYQYYPSSAAFSSSTSPSVDWDVSALGQYNFLKDLTSTLNNSSYSHVTGLYYWQPEECGSGTSSTVMNNWDNRGLWNNSGSGSHALQSATNSGTDVSSKFSNLDFENCTYGSGAVATIPGWTLNNGLSWSKNWAEKTSSYTSSLVGDTYMSYAYTSTNTSYGKLFYQSASVDNGTYTVTAVVHTNSSGVKLFANNTYSDEITTTSNWGTAYKVSVTTTVTDGKLEIGIYSGAQSSGAEIYTDNFTVTQGTATTVYPIDALTDFSGTYTDNFTSKQTIADETYVGTSDYLTGFAGAFSPTYTLASGQTYNLKFVNHNAGTDNVWNNWVLYAMNGSNYSTATSYFRLRNDNYELNSQGVVNGLTKNSSSYPISGDESNFITDMNGANVDMNITYTKGTSIAVSATITATDGDVYTYTYTDNAAADVKEDNVYLFLTVDHSYIDMKSATSSGDITTTVDGITYTINADSKTASATGCTDALPNDVYIPKTITYNNESYTVTSIGNEAFKGNTTINSLHTCNSIASVGESAFSGCTKLLYVSLGTGVTSIGNSAFNGCTALNILVLNSSSTIAYGTEPYTDVPSAARLYLSSAEFGKLTRTVNADKTVTYSGVYVGTTEYPFASDNICKTDIQGGIVYGLWDNGMAFAVGYTEDLPAQIIIPSKLHYDTGQIYPCTQYFMHQIEQYAFAKATGLTHVTVCNNTEEIGACAFRCCINLAAITFGEDMTTFYDNVFYYDTKLKSFTFYRNAAPTQWGYNGYTPITGLDNTTLKCPYSDANTAYTGFTTYTTLTHGTNGDTTYDINEREYDDQSETDVTKSSLIADAAPVYGTQYVTINRALTADNYYTLVVPWDLNATEVSSLGITPYYFNGGSWYGSGSYGNILYLSFDKTTTMQGGVPYLVKCTTSQTSLNLGLEFTSEYEDLIEKTNKGYSGNTVTFQGLYNKQNIPQGDFFVSGTKLYYTTDNKVPIGAFRAFLHIAANSGAKATQCAFSLEDGDISGVESVTLDSETLQPVGSSVYDITGRRLKALPSQKGLYIINGKKIMVK